jgi:UDP-N-acetylglucosamine/UDP-N-acetylgalactosamine diphosphorylase
MDAIKSKLAQMGLGKKEEAPMTQPPDAEAVSQLRKAYNEAGQGHVFQFWDALSDARRAELYEQANLIDPSRLNDIVQEATNQDKKEEIAEPHPIPDDAFTILAEQDEECRSDWYSKGLQLIADNKVGAIVMAGGQGTRLGSSDPKGCYNIGLPSQKSLFQLQAERILRLQVLAKRHAGLDALPTIYWYIMTSAPTHDATMRFFEKNVYFSLSADQVKFFDQGTLPCVDSEGKMLLEQQHRIAEAPDGNGGLYKALVTGGVVEHAAAHSIEHFHVYCVDNCLVKVADPTFLGWAADGNLQIATKSVQKKDPKESVGLIVALDGKASVVEYSEIAEDLAKQTDSSGALKLRAANIVQHYFSKHLIQAAAGWATKLPHHVAKKKIPYIDTDGVRKEPSSANGIKLEQFVFGVFHECPLDKFGCLEVSREDEFSPLKNLEGSDSPETSKRDLMGQGARWVRQAGGFSEDDGSTNGSIGGKSIAFSHVCVAC